MDETSKVDLELEPILHFELDKRSNCFILKQASKCTSEKLEEHTLMSETEFYNYENIDLEIKNLDVEGLKYTKNFKQKVSDILKSYNVKVRILDNQRYIDDLLKLPYASLCSVQMTEMVEQSEEVGDFMDPGVRDWRRQRNRRSANREENGITQKTIFRTEVIKLLLKYAIYDESEEGAKEDIEAGIHADVGPEDYLQNMILNRRSAFIYKRIREQIIARYLPSERDQFGTSLCISEFLEAIMYIGEQTGSLSYYMEMRVYKEFTVITDVDLRMHLDRYESSQQLLRLGSGLLKMLDDHNRKYTQEQQNALNMYQWIKVWFTSVRKLYVNREGASEMMPVL